MKMILTSRHGVLKCPILSAVLKIKGKNCGLSSHFTSIPVKLCTPGATCAITSVTACSASRERKEYLKFYRCMRTCELGGSGNGSHVKS